ncbi:hypothetical protein HK100_002467 [Physocladia obscura]|uniref:Protein PNS1 n=1 Tax=Physocladia obscura TaxID=109957 RepID=A0AAD5XDU2_9FUNG|nr:hypothetical protein HK100_002467 [Physocladia obscura]
MSKKGSPDEMPDYGTIPMGINGKRKCRDVWMIVLFLAFWCGMWIVANTALKYGSPMSLLLPLDSHGNQCGTSVTYNGVNLANLSYLYYNNPASPTTYTSVCVASCPTSTVVTTTSNYICDYGIVPTSLTLATYTTSFKCAPLIIQSQDVLGRCIPSDATITYFNASALSSQNTLQSILTDSRYSYYTTSTESGHDAQQIVWEYKAAQYGCWICVVLFAIMILITIFMRNKIRIACEVIKETSAAISKMPIITGSFGEYYWTLGDKTANMIKQPVQGSMYRTSRYHLGSIMFGAFLIAIVQTARVILMVFKKMAKKSKMKFLIPLINCCQCYLAWLERLVKWINKNAYIMIAIEGKAFCKSCTSALGLLIRNALKLIAVDLIGDFIIGLSKICITALVVLIFYGFLTWQGQLIHIQFIYVPLIIIGIIAFFISSGFMGVYSLGIDTIFMSFLIDSERNDGSVQHPYYMSESLKNIMHVSNKMREEDQKKKAKRVEPMAMEEY